MTPTEYLKKLGANIRNARINKQITQIALALLCEFDKGSLSRIEGGKINMTVLTLFKIANALDIELAELVRH